MASKEQARDHLGRERERMPPLPIEETEEEREEREEREEMMRIMGVSFEPSRTKAGSLAPAVALMTVPAPGPPPARQGEGVGPASAEGPVLEEVQLPLRVQQPILASSTRASGLFDDSDDDLVCDPKPDR